MQPYNTDHLTRQLDLIPMDALGVPITVVGAGAIGSTTILTLAKMGFGDIRVYDFDEVSVENMNCQYFRFSDIGRAKVEALKEIVADFTLVDLAIFNERWEKQRLKGIVIAAVDSMAVRKQIWEHVKGNGQVRWLIDPRMSAESVLSYVMNPNDEQDQASYEKTLYTDDHANSIAPERCTAKATMYTANLIAGYVSKHVKDLVTKSPYARITHWDIAQNTLLNWGKFSVKSNELNTGSVYDGIG